MSGPGARLVVAAAVVSGHRVLVARRSYPAAEAGRWEFPGGKVAAGETPRQALARECQEELGIAVIALAPLGADVPIARGLLLRLYLCLGIGQPLALEHQQIAWVEQGALAGMDWLPSNIGLAARVARMLPAVTLAR